MVRKREEIEELIARYLSGEASPDQAMDLDNWKTETNENQALYDAYEKTYHAVNGTNAFASPDLDRAWNTIENQLTPEAKEIPLQRNKWSYIMAVAAVGLIAFLIGGLFDFDAGGDVDPLAENPVLDTTVVDVERVIYASNNVESVTLNDQSVVELEAGSKLTLAKDFNKNERNAELEGSGRFTVVHDESNPFILGVSELDIFDVGTIFRVNTHDDTVKVAVDEGEVQLRLNGETIDLVAGDSAYYVISENVMERYKEFNARGARVFTFRGEKMEVVMQELSDFFGKKIDIVDDAIKECPVTADFPNESLGLILEILADSHNIEIVFSNSKIEIHGEDCK